MQLFSKYRNFTSCTANITTFWHIRKECPFVEEESPQQNLQWIRTFFPFSLIENNNQQIVEADYCAQHDQFFLFLCTSLSARSSKQAKEEEAAAAAIRYGQNFSKLLCNKM